MIGWLLGPIGRWFGAAGAVIAGVLTVYFKGQRDASERLRLLQAEDANRRIKNAIEADERVRRDAASGRLRDNDGHRRD
jgi:hypothetical protein